jgi:hypothetical protein
LALAVQWVQRVKKAIVESLAMMAQ